MSKSYSSNLIVSAVSRFNPQTIDELLLVFVTRFGLFFFTLAVGCFIRGYAARLQEVFPSAEQKRVYGNATHNVQSRAELFQAGHWKRGNSPSSVFWVFLWASSQWDIA
ncbi:hypothetical protein ILYODFUR_038103 [Ilyodon furcidens]|uniref:Uncharacterized protein n=1 Tax=Ilyodon furcidens TaxID=33524 RepID=A0ABV0TEV5_9TELE